MHGELVGAPDIAVSAVAPISRATPRDLSFLASARYAPLLTTSEPGVLLVTPELASSPGGARARVIVPKPHDALIDLLPRLYQPRSHTPGVHETARIGRGARLGRQVSIGPYVIIGDGSVIGDRTRLDAHVVIGDGVEVGPDGHLYPGATVYRGASLGARVTLHAGVVVGSDGFGYTFADGAHRKIPHVGRCIIEDDVEVGANATIDRGSIDDTIVGAGTKIDNLVQIGHNVRIGRLCLIMAQVGIAGSTRIGDGVILAGQVGLKGHLEVGDGARLAAQAGVFGDIPAGETWSGYPARPHRESLRASAALMRLSEIIHKLERLVSDRE